jgi:hypothetical protein
MVGRAVVVAPVVVESRLDEVVRAGDDGLAEVLGDVVINGV